MRYVLTLLLSLVTCFAAQTIALRAVGGKTTKSESNFFSSIARIQTGTSNSPEIMILGSSITGRLPDRAQGFAGIANLGCDGGSALDTLRAIDRGELPSPPQLWIEANTLALALSSQETEISQAIRSPMFKVGLKIPQLSATARPSAFAYSLLFQWKIGTAYGPDGKWLPTTSKPSISQNLPANLTSSEKQLAAEVSAILTRLRSRGTESWIVMMPPSQPAESSNHRLATAISAQTNIPFWDLGIGLEPNDFSLTDGVHMHPDSAAATVRTLLRGKEIQR